MKLLAILITLFLGWGCSSVKKAEEPKDIQVEKIDSNLKNPIPLNANTELGTDEEGMVKTQEKTQLIEHLHQLEYDVKKEYVDLYGNPQFQSHGLYGKLEDCRIKLNSKEYGGEGTYVQMPDHSSKISQIFEIEKKQFDKVGVDERGGLIALSEENLGKRWARFKGYREDLRARRAELEKDIKICEAQLKSRKWEKENPQSSQKENP